MDDLWYYLGMPPLAAVAVVISAVLLYAAFIVFSRLLGQRVLAQLSGFDLVVVIVLGAVIGRAILGHVPTLTAGLLALATILAMGGVIGQLTRHNRLERLVNNRPVLLMAGDQVVAEEMHRCHTTGRRCARSCADRGSAGTMRWPQSFSSQPGSSASCVGAGPWSGRCCGACGLPTGCPL